MRKLEDRMQRPVPASNTPAADGRQQYQPKPTYLYAPPLASYIDYSPETYFIGFG
jgi:hypothetical protein